MSYFRAVAVLLVAWAALVHARSHSTPCQNQPVNMCCKDTRTTNPNDCTFNMPSTTNCPNIKYAVESWFSAISACSVDCALNACDSSGADCLVTWTDYC